MRFVFRFAEMDQSRLKLRYPRNGGRSPRSSSDVLHDSLSSGGRCPNGLSFQDLLFSDIQTHCHSSHSLLCLFLQIIWPISIQHVAGTSCLHWASCARHALCQDVLQSSCLQQTKRQAKHSDLPLILFTWFCVICVDISCKLIYEYMISINIHQYTLIYCTLLHHFVNQKREVLWLELWLRVAAPHGDDQAKFLRSSILQHTAAYCSILQHTAASWELWGYMRHLETNWLNRVLYYSILPASELQKQRLVIQWLSVLLCVFHFAWTSKFPKLGFHDASARRTICDGSCRKCQAETFAMASAVLRSDRFSFLTSLVIPQAEAAKDSWHLWSRLRHRQVGIPIKKVTTIARCPDCIPCMLELSKFWSKLRNFCQVQVPWIRQVEMQDDMIEGEMFKQLGVKEEDKESDEEALPALSKSCWCCSSTSHRFESWSLIFVDARPWLQQRREQLRSWPWHSREPRQYFFSRYFDDACPEQHIAVPSPFFIFFVLSCVLYFH